MPYIGRAATNAGSVNYLDDISSGFDGSDTTFTCAISGTTITPGQENVYLYLDGVFQHPTDAYSISGSTITFTEAPANGVAFTGYVAGEGAYLDDGTVSTAKLDDDAVTASKLDDDGTGFQVGDLGVGGSLTSGDKLTVTGRLRASGGIIGDLTGDVTGNVTGNTSGTAATVTGAAQSAITSVGTLTALSVDGDIALLSANDKITDGTNNILERTAGGYITIGASAWNEIRLNTTGSTDFVLDNSGRVGIGNASPTSGVLVVKGSGDLLTLESTNSGTGGAQLNLNHVGGSQADGDSVGRVLFNGQDSNDNAVTYARIDGIAEDVTDGSENGALNFDTRTSNSAFSTKMTIASDGDIGIGITSPTTHYERALHIHESSGSSSIHMTNNTTGSGVDNGTDIIAYQDDFYIWSREASGNTIIGTNGTERMRIEAGGDIKMTELLYVNNAVNHGRTTAGSTFRAANNGNAAITLLSSATHSAGVGTDIVSLNFAAHNEWSTTKDGIYAQIRCENGNGSYADRGQLVFATGYNGNTIYDRMTLSYDGILGFDTGLPASATGATKGIHINTGGVPFIRYQETNSSGGTADYEIYVANGVYVLYDNDDSAGVYSVSTSQVISGDFNDTSDIGLKENIKTIDSGLSIINKLNPVTFDWKNKKKGSNSGFIAQEVEKILPNDVEGEDFNTDYPSGRVGDVIEDEDKGFNNFGKSINTSGIVAHLTKAVQELSAKVEALENA